MKDCIIVIPIYRIPTPNEETSIKNTLSKFQEYDCSFVIPKGLNEYAGNSNAKEKLKNDYPSAMQIEVDNRWLGPGLGVQGYNEMMLSKSFYERFVNYKYILICHPDAWVFRNDLKEWIDKNYDVVGAPWISRPHFMSCLWLRTQPPSLYIYKLLKKIGITKNIVSTMSEKPGFVGNGGFSLRKVKSIIRVCETHEDIIKKYVASVDAEFNEDVFWARVPENFKYPTQYEALSFSIDRHPRMCYVINEENLPMACHGYATSTKHINFWSKFINIYHK